MAKATPQNTHQQQLTRMLSAYWISQALYVAAKLGIADLLKDGPTDVRTLAQSTDADPRSLYRLLRALASVGVFSEGDHGWFSLTPVADCLRTDSPGSQRALALMMGEEQYRAWGGLLGSVRTGRSAFETTYGKPIFEYFAERPEQARVFDAAMTSIHGSETAAMIEAYDFSRLGLLADIGGGNGSTLMGILRRLPDLRGLLFDLPNVVARAQKEIAASRLSDRCESVGGSFFESIPKGADAYLLRHILHDWDDEKAIAILKSVHRAMDDKAKLLVVESVIAPGNAPSFGKLLDLAMLVIPGGLERTEEEYRQLFDGGGFRLTRIIPTAAEISVIEGTKIS
jgi:hypothetical protein